MFKNVATQYAMWLTKWKVMNKKSICMNKKNIKETKPFMEQSHKRVTVNATGCGFDSHSVLP